MSARCRRTRGSAAKSAPVSLPRGASVAPSPSRFARHALARVLQRRQLGPRVERRGRRGHKGAVNLLPDIHALLPLPLAALLGAMLAFRPRRRGTPPRIPAVIQTQVILAIMGALVMIVVGASMARAFGIVGAASLIRYRSKISDPKDAGVMLMALGVGLAAGVGLYGVAIAATLFVLVVLWLVESLERHAYTRFELKIGTKNPLAVRTPLEHLLSRFHAHAELRGVSPDEIVYSVRVPVGMRVDALADRIMKLRPSGVESVEWDEKKRRD